MRLALIAHAPALGGSTDVLVQVRDFFKQRGHETQTFFSQLAESNDPRITDAKILNAPRGSWRGKMRAYVDLVESFKPDVAYAFTGHHEMDLFRFLRCARVRHVSTLEQHGFADIPLWLRDNRDYIEALTANTPDAVEEVERHTGKKCYLLPYRLPQLEDAFRDIQLPTIIDGTRRLEVAFVSRLEQFQKRTQWLPEIILGCEKRGVPLNWNLYGDGPEGPSLRRKLARAKNVRFHGWTKRDALYKVLPDHDIFFLCSRWEGLPISMVEAMRCGVACVAPDIPAGIHWTLSHGGGWLYQANSPRDAINALAEAARDRDVLLERRRDAMRLAIELFPIKLAEDHYPKLEAAIRELKFNGNVLDPATAPKMRDVLPSAYPERIAHGVNSALRSPGGFLKRALKRVTGG